MPSRKKPLFKNNEMFHILKLYKESFPKIWAKHQIQSYNEFINNDVGNIIRQNNPVVVTVANTKGNITLNIKDVKYLKNVITFGNEYFKKPHHTFAHGGTNIIFPTQCLEKNLTYQCTIYCDIKHQIFAIKSDKSEILVKEIDHEKINIGKIPVMIHSDICNLARLPRDNQIELGEDINNPGGYFIINGNEKVVISKERKNMNHVKFYNNSANASSTYPFTSEISSQIEGRFECAHICTIMMDKKERLLCHLSPGFPTKKDIPVFIMFRALGIIKDENIIEYIVYDIENTTMIELIKVSMTVGIKDNTLPVGKNEIRTQESALLYIANRIMPQLLEASEMTDEKKIKYVRRTFEKHLLPHVGTSFKKKAYFLGYMIRKLLLGKMGVVTTDDRDNLANKRIDTPGVLMSYYLKYHMNTVIAHLREDISKEFRTKTQITNYDNIIKKIKSSHLENAFKNAFSTGNWSTSRNMNDLKQGTSQVLSRKSYLDMLGHIRRIITPSTSSGSAPNKKPEIRRLHTTHWGKICCVETPEGAQIGLVKNLASLCNISIKTISYSIRKILSSQNIILLEDITPSQIYENNYTKIFVDGDWFAVTRFPGELTVILRDARRIGQINATVSIIRDFHMNEIRIYTDSGRCLTPYFIVDQGNQLRLTRSLFKKVMNGEVTWDELIIKYSVIEYLGVQEMQYNCLIAMNFDDLANADPREYNYSHCEIHPCMIMGLIAGSIPFSDHNQGPRNLFASAQMKQGIGTYALNYFKRMDTKGFVLYYPERPLMTTMLKQLINYNEQPSGQNAIVAIMCYTGYNQEDSVIINKAAVDRGFFTCSYYKTYKEDTKNEEKFMKPDPEITMGIKKHSSYEHINKDGFIMPGSKIRKGDIIISKLHKTDRSTRISGNKRIEWKDNSVLLHEDHAIVDRVVVANNNDGYQFNKVRIRIQRRMEIGDKCSSLNAQKGTTGAIYNQEDMPFTERGTIPDIIINSHAIPSRMTIGQILESVYSKVCALKGHYGDATPFNEFNIEDVCQQLEDLGYDRYGNEKMYCGFSSDPIESKIFIGPTYYQRLQHIVADKIHSRANTGPDQTLVRQPLEGKARMGGLRFGKPFRRCEWQNTCKSEIHRRHFQIQGNS